MKSGLNFCLYHSVILLEQRIHMKILSEFNIYNYTLIKGNSTVLP